VQGDPIRYRFAYRKVGRASFLSHLDMIRVLSRAFRRLGIGMYHSSGYHPKPEMTYGPALSLGVSSLEEIVDVKLTRDLEPAEWLDRLSDACPDGLSFTGGARLAPEDGPAARAIRAARYAVAIPRSALGAVGGEAGLAALVDAFVRADSARVRRTIDGIGKWVDARRLTRAVRVHDPDAARHVALAGFAGDLVAIGVDVDALPTGSVKISEVVRAWTPDHAELPSRAVRVRMGSWSPDGTLVSPIDLVATRALEAGARRIPEDPPAIEVPAAPP
jgi:radical SAM-linked protein